MNQALINTLFKAHRECPDCPSSKHVVDFFDELMGILFPNFSTVPFQSIEELQSAITALESKLRSLLPQATDVDKVAIFFDRIEDVYYALEKDIEATFMGDPAAQSHAEVVRSYPGFYAIAAHRFAHLMLEISIDHLPRIISENAHSKTGIDIHPGATIGAYFCIDHGTGLVIGETTTIGDWVKIYQGVTLGALSVNKEDAKMKRHPSIEDHVVIYAGATILGGNTIVGKNSIIGGNVWLTKSVPEDSRVYYKAEMHSEDKQDLIIVKQG